MKWVSAATLFTCGSYLTSNRRSPILDSQCTTELYWNGSVTSIFLPHTGPHSILLQSGSYFGIIIVQENWENFYRCSQHLWAVHQILGKALISGLIN